MVKKRVLGVLVMALLLAAVLAPAVRAEIRPPIQIPDSPKKEPNPRMNPVGAWGFLGADVYLNGKLLDDWPDAVPYLDPETNRTMIPVRYLTESLGAKVSWADKEQKVTVELGGKTIELWVGKKAAKVDGAEKELDAPPVLRSWETEEKPPQTLWRTWVPLRFVTECLGGLVDWTPEGKPSKMQPGWNCACLEVIITYPAPK